MKKSAVKKHPFRKRQSSAPLGLIVGLTVFNLVYSYAVGLPLPRAIVASYVESVYALGDAQVKSYEVMGAAVAATVYLPAETYLASPMRFLGPPVEDATPPAPEPLLLVAPNQISIAK